jgi:hypothetical protein
VEGKVYGTHGLEGSLTTSSDLFYGDLRAIAFYPLHHAGQTTNGTALMEAAASADVPIVKAQDQSETRMVATYNISSLAGSELRDAYVRYRPGAADEGHNTYWTIGHFYVPFGLLTDEHRTYTRIQTNMTYNNFDTGAAYSRDFDPSFHLDVALVNDFQTGGAFNTKTFTWSVVGNFRWNPVTLPILLGASGNYEHINDVSDPSAGSLYGVLSFDRLTQNKISASLSAEGVVAHDWNNPTVNTGGVNPDLAQFFLPDPSLISSYLTTTSLGGYGLAKFWLNPHWYLFYKFDYLALNMSHLGSNFTRSGFGSEIWVNPNVSVNARVEFAGTSGLAPSNSSIAAEDDFFTMLRVWL